jgi:hypothetical protein
MRVEGLSTAVSCVRLKDEFVVDGERDDVFLLLLVMISWSLMMMRVTTGMTERSLKLL